MNPFSDAVNTRTSVTYLAPADAAPDWQHRIRISLIAGESAFANDDDIVVAVGDGEVVERGGDQAADRGRPPTDHV